MEAKSAYFRANTDIGQNFLVDAGVLDRIIAAADPQPGEILLEIGAGNGVLTRRLLSRSPARLYAVEMDRRLAPFLNPLEKDPAFILLWGDVLGMHLAEELSPCPGRLVANLPYHITTPLLWKLLEELVPAGLREMTLMVQKEAANRLAWGRPGKNRSPLGITLQKMGRVECLFDVPPSAFRPAPKVNSTVVSILIQQNFDLALDPLWRELLQRAFDQRRKTLLNNLRNWLGTRGIDGESLLRELALNEKVRAEELSLEDWDRLRKTLSEEPGEKGRS
ncbi:MAG: ribosomal RNA small subunit methyltransferase A [Synergistaceae bacterium]|jgi:16S rRNA (adenine1518-N6/adenine1519-N6)-dimethyltransferase|nr:ribosomal RNA small subunit methyltransferase A [Synergistaceae bacterium]